MLLPHPGIGRRWGESSPWGYGEPLNTAPWAEGGRWHEASKGNKHDESSPGCRQCCCSFNQALTEAWPFCNGDRKDYKQSLIPKQLMFTGEIEEQGKGQFCLLS